jgi:hypothetical protein
VSAVPLVSPFAAKPAPVPAGLSTLTRLARASSAQRRLLAWNRDLPRPAGTWVPGRVWRRHSAVLSLRRGAEL